MKIKLILPFLILFTALSVAADKAGDKDMESKKRYGVKKYRTAG